MALRRTVGLVLAVVLVGGTAACSGEPAATPNPVLQPGAPGEPNKTLSADEAASGVPATPPNAADVDYVRMMITHHAQAVEMTALAPTRGQGAPLKGLADRILNTQRPEMDMMNGWLERNGQPRVETGGDQGHGGEHGGHGGHGAGHEDIPHDMPGMATPEELTRLAASTGADFDRLFLELMIRHHEGAVSMAAAVQKDGSDITVQEMADNVIAEQTDEISRMRMMLGA